MKRMSQNNPTSHNHIFRWLLLALIVVSGLVASYFIFIRDTHEAKTTSTAKTAQNDYSDGRPRPTDGRGNDNSQGGATDNNGQTPPAPGDTSSITSGSGELTVNGIAKDSVLATGAVLSGSVKSDIKKVQFRVIDENAGVIAQGSLNVVNQSFSGTLSFKAQSSTGRLDVYTFDSAGTENNNIEIPIRFK